MASRLRLPTLALAALSIGLNIAVLGCAGRTLNVFQNQRHTNIYFLPVFTDHFDTRELSALIGTSAAVFILNSVLVAALFISALPANFLVLVSSLLSATVSLIAIIFSSVLNNRAPGKDTLQTWTCRWRGISNEAVPRQFDTLCHETRFAFYTTIPNFIIQLLLVSLAVYGIMASRRPSRGLRLDEEKDHELGQVRQQSFDTKTASVRSTPERVRVVDIKQ